MTPTLAWLAPEPDFDLRLAALKHIDDPAQAWREALALAQTRLDFTQTGQLDRAVLRLNGRLGAVPPHLQTVRVALLASSTVQHLLPSIRLAGLRRGLWIELYANAYGQYLQDLLDPASALHTFRPEICCLLLDAQHLAELTSDNAAIERLETCWRICRDAFSAAIIQQTALPAFEPVFGSNEQLLEDSVANRLQLLNTELRMLSAKRGIALLDAAQLAGTYGIDALHDPALWHLAKQEIHPSAAPVFGDALGRVVAALRGRSAKCLVLDLDNTLWGGVIGDDGLEGIQLGKGHAAGEAYLEFQRYCLSLKARGIALAVCSKNDDATARAPFLEHPAMLLREDDIACFVANWQDKATNLRFIARTLNLGLDALAFADDNPAERALIRQELPEVTVLELPEDPAGYIRVVARSGAFEAVQCTGDDRQRAEQYRANAEREALRETATDLHTYLAGLGMQAHVSPFTEQALGRITQLINKTNQFNLTTPRVSEAQVRAWMADPCLRTWQVRLTDRFGDNGTVALMSARVCGDLCELNMLLMSCRVLGRKLEDELFNCLGAAAREAGASRLTGCFRPTAKNGMVRGLLGRLGFSEQPANADGSIPWLLQTADFTPLPTEITVFEIAAPALAHQA